jgi:hypothetical protein
MFIFFGVPYVDFTSTTLAERFQKIYSIFLLSFISPKIVLHICFLYIGYLCIINFNTIIIYAQVKCINSQTDLPFEYPKMCKNYTLKSFKTDSKELLLFFAEFKKK